MKHDLKTPKDCDCGDTGHCNICDGGLALCKVCGGAEASLPTECPGRRMTEQEELDVQTGCLNYVNGHWVPGGGDGTL